MVCPLLILGGTQKATFSEFNPELLIDRSAGGSLGPITLRNGRDIIGSATTEFLGFTAGVLGAVGAAAEYLDYLDPIGTYLFGNEVGINSDIKPNTNPAGGGFVLYPSKPNTNVMRQVYRK